MSSESTPSVLRSVSWRDLCPWLLLFRTFSVSIAPSVLVLGTIGAIVMPLGWRVADIVFLSQTKSEALSEVTVVWQRSPLDSSPERSSRERGSGAELKNRWLGPLARQVEAGRLTLAGVAESLWEFRIRRLGYFLFGGAWTLLVYTLLGGAISRKAVVVLGAERRESVGDALRHAWRRLPGYALAPLYPMIVIAVMAALCAFMGLLMRVEVLAAVVSLFWVIALLAGAAAAILIVGLVFGWPLMWGAVSAEEDGEAFEALSRAYSYIFGRPLHLLFYVAVAAFVGALGLVAVELLTSLTVGFATQCADWGSGGVLRGDLRQKLAGAIIHWQNLVVGAVITGFEFAFFWVASAAIYLLVRADVDHTELDEIYLPDDTETLSLPSLQLDASGAVAMKPEQEPTGETGKS